MTQRPHNADEQNAINPRQDGRMESPSPEIEDEMITQMPAPPTLPRRSQPTPHISQALEQDLVQVFKLLADETRLRVLLYLMQEGELHVSALCDRLGQSQPAVSHHLALLRDAGLIAPRRDGKHNFYSVKKTRFHSLIEKLFESMTDGHDGEVRFDDYVLSHEP